MAKIFLALLSGLAMLCLPSWISGEAYPSLQHRNFKKLTSYTEPYYQLIQKVDELIRPKKIETVVVAAWQDNEGNMHFSNQGQAPQEEHAQSYEVKNYHNGRFAYPAYWAWTSMFVVWLVFYISSL